MAAPAPPSESQMPLTSTYIFSGVTVLDVPARPLKKSIGKYFLTIAIDGKEEWKSREIRTRGKKVAWNQKEDKYEFESASNSTWKVTLCKNHSRSKPVEQMGSITLPLDGWMQRFMVAQLVSTGNQKVAITVQVSVTKKEATILDSSIALHDSVEAADGDGDNAGLLAETPGLGAVSTAVDEVQEHAGDVVEALNGLLGKLEPFIMLMDKVSEVHPYLKIAWSILSAALKAAKAQQERDEKMQKLIEQMKAVYAFLCDARGLKDDKAKLGVLSRLALQTVDSAHFVSSCIGKTNFATRLAKQAVSNVDAKLDEYKDSFHELLQYFQYGSQLRTEIATMSILEDVKAVAVAMDLNYIPFTGGAGYQTSKQCLENTRTKLLDEIGLWANNSASETSRLFVLMGPAGTGKSTIAHTMPHRFKLMHRLGASFCFSNEASVNRKPTSLFRNIARNLAQMYPAFRTALWNTIQGDMDLCTTEDLNDQFDKFILEPARSLAVNGIIFIMIDALDESGTVQERQKLLLVLFRRLNELPTGFRFFITCRGEDDIRSLIPGDGRSATLREMPTLADDEDLLPDMLEYVRHQLSYRTGTYPNGITDGHCRRLSDRAEGLFQWAFVACDTINSLRIKTPLAICETLLRETSSGGRLEKLDTLYKNVLDQILSRDRDELPSFKATMGFVLSAVYPLSRLALRKMMSLPSTEKTLNAVTLQERILPLLGSLLSGVGEDDVPVRVLHSSFREFLRSSKRGEDYYIGTPEMHHGRLATASLRLLNERLHFNMGGLDSSYQVNRDAISLAEAKTKVPEELLYACKHWGIHISQSAAGCEQNVACIDKLFNEKFLFWLDAASIMEAVGDVTYCITVALPQLQKLDVEIYNAALDGLQFTRVFSDPIRRSAAHIYISALTWSPTTSYIDKRYRKKYGRTAQIVSGLPPVWPVVNRTIYGHRDRVWSVAFSPDGKRIVSGSEDKTIRLWDAETGAALEQPLMGHYAGVISVVFSPDGKRIASGSYDYAIRMWDAETGAAIGGPLGGHNGWVNSVAFSPDGRRLASGLEDKMIQFWDAETGAVIGEPLATHDSSVFSVAFSPDGKRVASACDDKTIRMWDVETAATIGEPLVGHDDSVNSVAFSPDAKRIVSGSVDGTIRIWDLETGTAIGEPLTGHDDWVNSVAFSPDGRRIASGSTDETIRMWDVETGAALGKPLIGHDGSVNSVAFSPDGRRIASGSTDETIRMWDVETGATIGEPLVAPDDSVWSVVFSPDGKRIASGSTDETISMWDVGTGKAIGEPLVGHENWVHSVAFSPNGKRIASGSNDRTIRIWDVQMGVPIGEPLNGHDHWVTSVVFSPDGKRIASGSGDKTIRIWDARKGAGLEQLPLRQDGGISAVASTLGGRGFTTALSGSAQDNPSETSLAGSWNEHRFCLSPWAGDELRQLYAPGNVPIRLDRETGWIMGNETDYIFWIPPYLVNRVSLGRMLVRIPGPAIFVDLSKFAQGTEWQTCYTGSS